MEAVQTKTEETEPKQLEVKIEADGNTAFAAGIRVMSSLMESNRGQGKGLKRLSRKVKRYQAREKMLLEALETARRALSRQDNNDYGFRENIGNAALQRIDAILAK